MSAPAGRLSRLATAALVVLLGALVVAGAVFGPGAGDGAQRPPYALDSAQPDGLLALVRWLDALGYDAGTLDGPAPPAAADRLVFVWPGERPFTAAEAEGVVGWVRAGGTLALVGPTWNERALGAALGVRLADAAGVAVRLGPAPTLAARQPLVPAGPAGYGPGAGPALDLAGAPAAVAVVGGGDGPTVAVQAVGRGRVWHFSPRHDFTNHRLAESDDAALLAPLLRHVPPGGRVRFDAYHLATPGPGADGGAGGLRGWLWGSGPGRAILWLAALALSGLALAGRRLGPPLPAAVREARRTEAEFVSAMAGLHRRADDRALVVDHLRAGLARAARRGGLDAATQDRLAAIDGGLAAAGDGAALLRWAAAAEAALDALAGRTAGAGGRGRAGQNEGGQGEGGDDTDGGR